MGVGEERRERGQKSKQHKGLRVKCPLLKTFLCRERIGKTSIKAKRATTALHALYAPILDSAAYAPVIWAYQSGWMRQQM
jgi:hypothetical protein